MQDRPFDLLTSVSYAWYHCATTATLREREKERERGGAERTKRACLLKAPLCAHRTSNASNIRALRQLELQGYFIHYGVCTRLRHYLPPCSVLVPCWTHGAVSVCIIRERERERERRCLTTLLTIKDVCVVWYIFDYEMRITCNKSKKELNHQRRHT